MGQTWDSSYDGRDCRLLARSPCDGPDSDLESIRGVQSGELLRALMEKDLVKIVGRDSVPGAPVLYGTTKNFLEVCGLKSLKDLPKPEEVK